jgi:hypothetical protein
MRRKPVAIRRQAEESDKASMYLFLYEGLNLIVEEMFDVDGDETENLEDACSIVAQLPDGQWLAARCDQGELRPLIYN